jgi:hypothetical protein
MTTLTKQQTNLDRLAEMTLVQFETPLERCTIQQIQQAVECIIAENAFFEQEDLSALDSENAYYGLIAF